MTQAKADKYRRTKRQRASAWVVGSGSARTTTPSATWPRPPWATRRSSASMLPMTMVRAPTRDTGTGCLLLQLLT